MLKCSIKLAAGEGIRDSEKGSFGHLYRILETDQRRPLEVIKAMILALYDAGLFPKDDFMRRAQHSLNKRETPKENEYFTRGMEMLLALQERCLVAKMQSTDMQNDLNTWLELFAVLSKERDFRMGGGDQHRGG